MKVRSAWTNAYLKRFGPGRNGTTGEGLVYQLQQEAGLTGNIGGRDVLVVGDTGNYIAGILRQLVPGLQIAVSQGDVVQHDGTFDAAIAFCCLADADNPADMLARLKLAVHKGGRVALLELDWFTMSILGSGLLSMRELHERGVSAVVRHPVAIRELLLDPVGAHGLQFAVVKGLRIEREVLCESGTLDASNFFRLRAIAQSLGEYGQRWWRELLLASEQRRFYASCWAHLGAGKRNKLRGGPYIWTTAFYLFRSLANNVRPNKTSAGYFAEASCPIRQILPLED